MDIFSNQIALYRGVTQGDNSQIQNAVFLERKTSGKSKLSKDLAILILEFDDVTVSRMGLGKRSSWGHEPSPRQHFYNLGKLVFRIIKIN